jgi:hypothetical protein
MSRQLNTTGATGVASAFKRGIAGNPEQFDPQ